MIDEIISYMIEFNLQTPLLPIRWVAESPNPLIMKQISLMTNTHTEVT